MSCDSLSQQTSLLNVSLGSLPEGFCPSSTQELGNAIAARLVITPNQSSSSFAIGPIAPTSNVGPWLKDCESWYIWDDATSTYIPIEKGGFNTFQTFTSNGTFTVPDGIFKVMLEGWGGGGGGTTDPAIAFSGGGGGFGRKIINVSPGQNIAVDVGPGGIGGVATGGDGGPTIFTRNAVVEMTCGGGFGGVDATTRAGLGGTTSGAGFSVQGGSGTSCGGDFGRAGDGGGGGGAGGVEAVAAATDFKDGKTPGGGGIGGSAGRPVGNGARGEAIIWY